MPLRHRLAAAIWAAIFVIAAQFFAGSALAHVGHAHPHSAASHASAAELPDHAKAPGGQQVWFEQADLSVSGQDGADMPVTPQSGGCVGGCCGNGIGCCGAVLAATTNPILKDSTQLQTIFLAFGHHSGIDPEALARPPRTLA